MLWVPGGFPLPPTFSVHLLKVNPSHCHGFPVSSLVYFLLCAPKSNMLPMQALCLTGMRIQLRFLSIPYAFPCVSDLLVTSPPCALCTAIGDFAAFCACLLSVLHSYRRAILLLSPLLCHVSLCIPRTFHVRSLVLPVRSC